MADSGVLLYVAQTKYLILDPDVSGLWVASSHDVADTPGVNQLQEW